MTKSSLQMKKSIMYKIISLGCSVYVDEWDDFVITILVCQDCNSFWNKSRTECLYCGAENYHVYRCSRCGDMYSLTNSTQRCNNFGCSGRLIKQCINHNCISNTNNQLFLFLEKHGGVFNIGKAGSTLNEVHCKNCGGTVSTYKSIKARFVENIDKLSSPDENTLYMARNDIDDVSGYYNGASYYNISVKDLLASVFEIGKIGLLDIM